MFSIPTQPNVYATESGGQTDEIAAASEFEVSKISWEGSNILTKNI